jgi:hypothetical protein
MNEEIRICLCGATPELKITFGGPEVYYGVYCKCGANTRQEVYHGFFEGCFMPQSSEEEAIKVWNEMVKKK